MVISVGTHKIGEKKILVGRDYERISAQNVKIAFRSISNFIKVEFL
jgi:hypothetical protein